MDFIPSVLPTGFLDEFYSDENSLSQEYDEDENDEENDSAKDTCRKTHKHRCLHVFNGAGCYCIGVLTKREPSVGEVEVVVEVGRELGSSARLRNIAQVDVFVSTVRSSCDQHELMFMLNV